MLLCIGVLAGCSDGSAQARFAAAKEYLAKGDVAAAAVALKSAIAEDPELAAARYLLGKVLLDTGQPAAAAIELRKALDLKHPSSEVVPDLVRAMYRQGQFKALTEEFAQTTLEDSSALADLKTLVAASYLVMGMRAQAEAELDKALEADPRHPEPRVLRARWLAAVGDIEKARALVAEVLAERPDNASAWKMDGDLRRMSRTEPDKVLAAYRKTIELDRYNLAAHASAIEVLLAGTDTEALRKQIGELKAVAAGHPQTRFFEAWLAVRGNDLPAARTALAQVLSAVPEHVRARELAGIVELRLGAVATAQSHFALALSREPYNRSLRRFLAQTHLQQGRAGDALSVLKPALGATADARTLALAGRAYLQAGDAKRAREAFARAVKLDASDTASKTALALGTIGSGGVEAGTRELEKLAADDAGNSADMALISALLVQRRFDEAFRAIDRLESKTDKKAAVMQLRGRAKLIAGDSAGARASFERALSLDPRYFPATASLVSMDLAEKKPGDARKRLEELLRAEPKHTPALLALAELTARTGGNAKDVGKLLEDASRESPGDASVHVRLVDHYLRTGQPKLALEAAQRAWSTLSATGHPGLWDALGRAQIAVGEVNRALTTYLALSSQHPGVAPYLLRLGEVNLALNKLAAARTALKQALSIQPNLLDAQILLTRVELTDKRPQDALAVARQIQKQQPRKSVGFLLEGNVQAALGKPDAAATAYRKSLELQPDPRVAVSLHSMLVQAGKKAESARFASEWRKVHPKDARFIFHLGDDALRRGDLADAEARYREVLALTPDNYLALNNVAWTLARQAKPGALAFVEKATKLRPDDVMILGTLAFVLTQDKQYERAIATQKKAMDLAPQAHPLKLDLARMYLAAGRKEQARVALNELAALGDGFKDQAEVARLLAQSAEK